MDSHAQLEIRNYAKAIGEGRFATHKGHALSADDKLRARLIEMLMCDFEIRSHEVLSNFEISKPALQTLLTSANAAFQGRLSLTPLGLGIPPDMRPLTRLIANHFDAYDLSKAGHSSAI